MEQLSEFIGVTFSKIEQTNDEILFYIKDDLSAIRMHHSQDCCESVTVEDVIGDLQDLVDTPILNATVETESDSGTGDDSSTWTFYKIETIKGSVTIRWYGSSSGYYSESVDIDILATCATCKNSIPRDIRKNYGKFFCSLSCEDVYLTIPLVFE